MPHGETLLTFKAMRPALFCTIALFLALPTSAQPRHNTVLDYYKMLPTRFFEMPHPESARARLQLLREGFNPRQANSASSIVDMKNDYLCVFQDAHGFLTLAVFRYHSRENLAVFDDFEEGELSFWRLRNGRLREVTRSVFPKPLPEVSVELPRKGVRIWIFEGNGYKNPKSKMVYGSFYWSKGHFYREPG